MINELFKRACEAHQGGNFQEALVLYHELLQTEPSFTPAHYNLGILFLAQQQYEYARIQFTNVLTLSPTHYGALKHLAECCLQLEKLAEAEDYFRQYCAFQSADIDALNNLGVVLLKQKRGQEAIDYFTQALIVEPTRVDIRSNLAATFLSFDRYEQAIVHYEEILKKDSDDLDSHYNIAVALTALGEYSRAIVHYKKVVAHNPGHVATLTNLGATALQQEQKAIAETYFTRVLQIDPTAEIARFHLAALQGKTENRTPPAYVRNLFDAYAYNYDRHLRTTLQYQLPEQIKLLLSTLPLPPKPWRILDCGAGTGLIGEMCRTDASLLMGIDLSEKMLAIAKEKKCYDTLLCGDCRDILPTLNEKFDVIIAADVFAYCGELENIIQNCYDILDPKGILIFSVEISEVEKFILQPTARFAYSKGYLEALRAKFHWQEQHCQIHTIRQQNHQAVEAYIIAWQK